MIRLTKKSLMTAALSVGATLIAGSACAGDKYPPPEKRYMSQHWRATRSGRQL